MKNTKLQKYYPWIVVALLWVVALLNYMDRQMLSTMRESMQVDIAELEEAVNFGRLMAIFLWIYGLVSPVAGAVADRISRKWLIVGSLGVWSAVTLLMGYSTSFGQIYWLRALMGISEALYIPASLSLIADYHTGKARSFAIGVHMTGLYVGQAVGGFGATVASMFSWQETFHWFGIIGIAYAVVLIFFLHENRGPGSRRPRLHAPRRTSRCGAASGCCSRTSPSGSCSSTSLRRRCPDGPPRTGCRRSSPTASGCRCPRPDRSPPLRSPSRRSSA